MTETRTVLITGATSGLGRSLAEEFALRGWRIAVHGRHPDRLIALQTALEPCVVQAYVADITELAELRRMCAKLRADLPGLDVIINNAAVGGGVDPTTREVNSDGTELRMAGNFLAPYVINRELAALVAARRGRIVNVASMGQAPIDVDDFDFQRSYDGVTAYCRSKLAMIMDTVDFAVSAPEGVTVNAVHPAHLMPTAMVRDSGFVPAATIDDGLLPVLRIALDTDLDGVSGRYFHRFDQTTPHEQAADERVRRLLSAWAQTRT
jgi:NAD(P)-dependent dehydrogenase (short-subunit alcohol dehydrogenase family)